MTFRTPDQFPGDRIEEVLQLESGSYHPITNGEISYVSGVGFRFFQEGVERGLSSGIDETTHEDISTLTHDLVRSSYDTVTYALGGNKVTNYVQWTDITQTQKLREYRLLYLNGGPKLSDVISVLYSGSNILYVVTESITYDSKYRITNVNRIKSGSI